MNKIKNTKQAFTFVELMISLVVIAIITVILYPTLADMAPNNNRYLFKSAYRTLETVTSDIMNTSELKMMPTDSATKLCEAFCERLNVVQANIWGNDGAGNQKMLTSSCNNCTNFKTSNGMRWAFMVDSGNKIDYILVDVNTANNKKAGTINTINKNVAGASPFGTTNPWTNVNGENTGVFYTNDVTTQDTFLFSIDSAGKITPHGTIAAQHMQSGN